MPDRAAHPRRARPLAKSKLESSVSKHQLTNPASCCSVQGSAEQCSIPGPDGQGGKTGALRFPGRNTALAALVSLPWCCILPAVLSLLSLTGAMISRVWIARLTWVFLPLSVLLLGRAFWLLYVKHQGRPWTRRLTWAAAFLVVILWAPRLWAWIYW